MLRLAGGGGQVHNQKDLKLGGALRVGPSLEPLGFAWVGGDVDSKLKQIQARAVQEGDCERLKCTEWEMTEKAKTGDQLLKEQRPA